MPAWIAASLWLDKFLSWLKNYSKTLIKIRLLKKCKLKHFSIRSTHSNLTLIRHLAWIYKIIFDGTSFIIPSRNFLSCNFLGSFQTSRIQPYCCIQSSLISPYQNKFVAHLAFLDLYFFLFKLVKFKPPTQWFSTGVPRYPWVPWNTLGVSPNNELKVYLLEIVARGASKLFYMEGRVPRSKKGCEALLQPYFSTTYPKKNPLKNNFSQTHLSNFFFNLVDSNYDFVDRKTSSEQSYYFLTSSKEEIDNVIIFSRSSKFNATN